MVVFIIGGGGLLGPNALLGVVPNTSSRLAQRKEGKNVWKYLSNIRKRKQVAKKWRLKILFRAHTLFFLKRRFTFFLSYFLISLINSS